MRLHLPILAAGSASACAELGSHRHHLLSNQRRPLAMSSARVNAEPCRLRWRLTL